MRRRGLWEEEADGCFLVWMNYGKGYISKCNVIEKGATSLWFILVALTPIKILCNSDWLSGDLADTDNEYDVAGETKIGWWGYKSGQEGARPHLVIE